jgi:hypothetical protein
VRRHRRRLIKFALATAAITFATAIAPAASAAPENPYALHSMLQVSSPHELKRQMFANAAASGASEIRLDASLGALNNPWISDAMWNGLDDYVSLSREYGIRVLLVLDSSNDPRLETCEPGVDPSTGQCGVTDLADYYTEIAALVQRVRGAIDDFEIVNEPDGQWTFTGTPAQYAGMLSTAYAAVHINDPSGRVVLGGIMTPADQSWLAASFTTPGFDAVHKFDVANVHLRAPLASLPGQLVGWRKFFTFFGDENVPLWVTETGYPSDPAYQYDPGFRGADGPSGQAAQAAFLSKSLPVLLFAGAAKVFVTERDNLSGQYASEGLLGGNVADEAQGTLAPIAKDAFYTFSSLAHSWSPPVARTVDPPPPPPPPATAAPARLPRPVQSLGRAVRRFRAPASLSGRAKASPVHRSRRHRGP